MAADITIVDLSVTVSSAQPTLRKRLIAGVSLKVPASSICAVMGRSGSGKTTLLKSIANILDRKVLTPSDSVKVVKASAPEETLPSVGVVFQQPFLFPWHTALQNVELQQRIHGAGDQPPEMTPLELLKRVGLGDHLNKYPRELSGGMQQRVALAREFARPLDLLLMDEPFRTLDRVTQEELIECLLTFWRNFNPTIVIITHDPAEAVLLADQIVVMGEKRDGPEAGSVGIIHRQEISNSFPGARGLERMASANYQELVQCTLGHLRSEA